MPNHRTPLAKAAATGRIAHDPQRFRDRKEPQSVPLGEPPEQFHIYTTEDEQAFSEMLLSVWEMFKKEAFWLTEADRSLVEIATVLRTKVLLGTAILKDYSTLITCLGRLGLTPVDRSRIQLQETDKADPADEFLN